MPPRSKAKENRGSDAAANDNRRTGTVLGYSFKAEMPTGDDVGRFRQKIAPALAQKACWGSDYFEDQRPASIDRVRFIVGKVFHDPEVQLEVDRFIDVYGTVDTTAIESIYLDAAVKFYLAAPAMRDMFHAWHRELPSRGTIVHYGTSSGTESAWLLHQAPERVVLQVDGNDAAFDSGQKKLVRISQGRATDYTAIKREPWRPAIENQQAFADGAIIHRVPPFPLENRIEMLKRARSDLKPGGRLLFIEPNLESGGNPAELEDFIVQIGSSSVDADSGLTEFDLALVARVKQRCLTEPGFHMFREQMASFFLSYSEIVTLAESLGFRVASSTPALHGRVYYLVLEKPATESDLDDRFQTEISVRVFSDHFLVNVVPRRNELRCDVRDREHYRRLAVGQMMTSRYGLEQASYLTEDMRNFDEHVVFAIRSRETRDIAGMARLIPFFQTRKFVGMGEHIRRHLLQRKVMCMSIYYEDAIRGRARLEREALQAALACCLKYRDRGLLHDIYAEIKAEQEPVYSRMGCQRIGAAFEVEGWSGSFIPVVLDFQVLEELLAHREKLNYWKQATGEALDVEFVSNLFRLAREG